MEKICRPGFAIFAAAIFILSSGNLLSAGKDADTDFSKTIEVTTDLINQYQEQYDIKGISIALVHKDKMVWAEGFGYADKEKGIKAAPETIYMLCSISKTLTTVMLLILYEQNIVKLDAPAYDYIPELAFLPQYENQDEGITVKRLLNHHSGIPGDVLNGAFTTEIWDGCNLQILDYFRNDLLAYRPGEVYSYCNTGFMLAGEIIQRAGGTNYVNFAEEKLLKPLGMNNTHFYTIKENLAAGYQGDNPVDVSAFSMNPRASGGAFTNVVDMSQFIIMLVGKGLHPNGTRILSEHTVENILPESESSTLDIDSYFVAGLGLDSVSDAPMKYAGSTWAKNGSAGFYGTLMEIIPDYDLGVIVMMNTAHLFRYEIVRKCLQQAIIDAGGPAPEPPVLPEPDTETDPAAIEGLYYSNPLSGLVSHDGKSSVFSKIEDNGDGTLTWFYDTTSQNPQEFILSLSGKAFVTDAYPDVRYEFRNIECQGTSHFVMVQHGSTGSLMDEYVYGGYVLQTINEKYSPGTIPDKWKSRYGRSYVPVNTVWSDASFTGGASSYSFSETGGVLTLDSGGKPARPLIAQDDDRAFVPGTSNRGDKLVCFRNDEVYGNVMQFNGMLYADTADFAELARGQSQKISLSENKTQWLRIAGQAGESYVLSCSSQNAVMSLYNSSLSAVFDSNLAPVREWNCQNTGTYYLAVIVPLACEITVGNTAPPVLSTPFVSSDGKTVSIGAEILANCAESTALRGIVWSTERDFPPETGAAVSESGSFGTGNFLVEVPGLPDGAPVYYRAFAENSSGRTYSAQRLWIPGMKAAAEISARNGNDRISTRGIPLEIEQAGFSPGKLKSVSVDNFLFDLAGAELNPNAEGAEAYSYGSPPDAESKFRLKLDFRRKNWNFKNSGKDLSSIGKGTFADLIIKDKDDKEYGVGIFQKEKISWKFNARKNESGTSMPPSGFAMDQASVKKLDASWDSNREKGTFSVEISPFSVGDGWTFGSDDSISISIEGFSLEIPSRNTAPEQWTSRGETKFNYNDRERGISLNINTDRGLFKLRLKKQNLSELFGQNLTMILGIGRYSAKISLDSSRKITRKAK